MTARDSAPPNPGNRKYRSSSGQIEVSVQTEEQWHALAVCLGRPELAYAGAWEAVRAAPPRGRLGRLLESLFAEDSAEVWVRRLDGNEVPAKIVPSKGRSRTRTPKAPG